jgi:Protein of unknown function (DUF2490)
LQSNIFKIALFIIISCFYAKAQHYSHTTLWTRLSLQKKTKTLDNRIEFDLRGQNDFHKSTINPTQKPLMKWIRINSAYTKGHFTYSFIPAIIKSYQLIGSDADFKKAPKNEFRLSFYDELSIPKTKFTTKLRLGYEFRDFYDATKPIKNGRVRFRILESYKVSDKTLLLASMEPQLNIWPNEPPNLFSSNQIYVRIQQNLTKHLKLETGYNNIFRKRASLIEYDYENAFVCNLTISL